MSYFIGSSSQYSYATVDEEKVKLATIQYTAMSTTFNKVLKTCEAKCLGHEYGEGDLNTGEQCCVDRCVSKYVSTNMIIGNNIQQKRFNPLESMPEYQKVKLMLEASAQKK